MTHQKVTRATGKLHCTNNDWEQRSHAYNSPKQLDWLSRPWVISKRDPVPRRLLYLGACVCWTVLFPNYPCTSGRSTLAARLGRSRQAKQKNCVHQEAVQQPTTRGINTSVAMRHCQTHGDEPIKRSQKARLLPHRRAGGALRRTEADNIDRGGSCPSMHTSLRRACRGLTPKGCGHSCDVRGSRRTES